MITDKQLIEEYRSGREEALEQLIGRYSNDVYRFCCHLTLNRQDGEDLFQEVWVRILRKLNTYDPERPLKAWLLQVTFNLYRDHYRKWKRLYGRLTRSSNDHTELLQIRDNGPLAEENLLRNEQFKYLEQCLHKLPKRYLAPLILYYYEEFSYEGIGNVLGIPLGTVKSRLNQGKKLLQSIMKEGNDGQSE